jgi:ribosomal protein L11 methylase PrmA
MLGLIDHLRSTIERLIWDPAGTVWAEYTADNTYTADARERKHQLVAEFLKQCAPRSVWDLGANVGEYSRVAAGEGFATVAFDFDPACVERNYLEVVRHGERNLLPLFTDLTNPSPALGWAGQERLSLLERGPAGAILALALVHHLAIANNVPLSDVAEFLHRAGHWLVIEFVPKEDVQVVRLLRSREDIFDSYDQAGFEAAFQTCFTIVRCEPIPNSERILYLMKRRERG